MYVRMHTCLYYTRMCVFIIGTRICAHVYVVHVVPSNMCIRYIASICTYTCCSIHNAHMYGFCVCTMLIYIDYSLACVYYVFYDSLAVSTC